MPEILGSIVFPFRHRGIDQGDVVISVDKDIGHTAQAQEVCPDYFDAAGKEIKGVVHIHILHPGYKMTAGVKAVGVERIFEIGGAEGRHILIPIADAIHKGEVESAHAIAVCPVHPEAEVHLALAVESQAGGPIGAVEGVCYRRGAGIEEGVGMLPDYGLGPGSPVIRRFHHKEVRPAVGDDKGKGIPFGRGPGIAVGWEAIIFGRTHSCELLIFRAPGHSPVGRTGVEDGAFHSVVRTSAVHGGFGHIDHMDGAIVGASGNHTGPGDIRMRSGSLEGKFSPGSRPFILANGKDQSAAHRGEVMGNDDLSVGAIRRIGGPSGSDRFNAGGGEGAPAGSIEIVVARTAVCVARVVHPHCPGSSGGAVVKHPETVLRTGIRLQIIAGFANEFLVDGELGLHTGVGRFLCCRQHISGRGARHGIVFQGVYRGSRPVAGLCGNTECKDQKSEQEG